MFSQPLVTDERNQILKKDNYSIEVDVWINKLTKKKHLMVYIHPIGTFIGDDLWAGFKFAYSDLDDTETFFKTLFAKYQKSLARDKRKGRMINNECIN